MAVIEGYSEHVMDAVGERVLPAYAGLRAAMERRRRNRSYPERVLQRLLGLDLKMRQYEEGKAFCDGVVERGGIESLNRVWDGPDLLPSARTARRATTQRAKAEATGLQVVVQQAERAVLIPVGATLTARDNVVETVRPFVRRLRGARSRAPPTFRARVARRPRAGPRACSRPGSTS